LDPEEPNLKMPTLELLRYLQELPELEPETVQADVFEGIIVSLQTM
jgi:hypothetical protein